MKLSIKAVYSTFKYYGNMKRWTDIMGRHQEIQTS